MGMDIFWNHPILKGKYEAKLEFLGRGRRVHYKKPSVRGVWIFSHAGTAHYQ